MRIELPHPLDQVLRKPTWPGTLERPDVARGLGVDYDTGWARSPAARLARAVLVDNVTRPLVRLAADPQVSGREHLEPLDGPVIFAANHTSHLDTAIVLSSLPVRFRHHTVVAAAADYFFDRHWKSALWALTLGTIPIERTKVNRRSADLAAELLADGWSLVIFPEGGRSTDGWGQEFRGGAAYLAKRCGVPVVPLHLRGVRPVFPKGSGRLRPGKVEVRFGTPLAPVRRARAVAARRTPGDSPHGSRPRSPSWPTRPRATGGPPAGAPPPARRPPSAGPRPPPGGAPGSCRRAPGRTGRGVGSVRPSPGRGRRPQPGRKKGPVGDRPLLSRLDRHGGGVRYLLWSATSIFPNAHISQTASVDIGYRNLRWTSAS